MKVVIVGCGRSGSALATRLQADGDEVSVVDIEPHARAGLARDFDGRFTIGNALHRDVLEAAGIDTAEAVVTLTASDSLNVVVARAARDHFRVPRVVGRLSDVSHASVCAELGLPMVTSVRMTVDRVHRMLHHARLEPAHTFGNGESLLVRSPVPEYLSGRKVDDFNVPGEIQVVEVTRAGHSRIPGSSTTLQRDDVVSFVVASGALSRLRSFLGGKWQ